MSEDLDAIFNDVWKESRDIPLAAHGITKTCNVCLLIKPVADFYLRKDKIYQQGYGYTSKCKECSKNKTREYWRRYRKAPISSCGICGKIDLLVKDHCHATGMNRGMLCQNCNKGLGHFKDNTGFLLNAVTYIRKYGGT